MASEPQKLPHLLKLLDDESETVQRAVLKELLSYGPALDLELKKQVPDLTEDQRRRIRNLLEGQQREVLKENWPGWFSIADDKEKLEAAFSLLADFQSGPNPQANLKTLLDELAEEYRRTHARRDEISLADFLFKTKRLQGAETGYDNPDHSNLIYVIQNKKGIPISLAAIYILVAHRLGLRVEGCNFPSHFLARIYQGSQIVLVDCFNGGKFLSPQDIQTQVGRSPALEDILRLDANAETMIARVLNNLVRAYEHAEDEINRQLMLELLGTLRTSGEENDDADSPP